MSRQISDERLQIAHIVIGERRREDLGDIDGLARSITRYGLLHPIVVDDDNRLVAGERRLRACQQLGHSEIDVRRLAELTEPELREIELEENLRRKDLTEYERSKTITRRAHLAREMAFRCRCGETFPEKVWHCDCCAHHWLPGLDDECKQCRSAGCLHDWSNPELRPESGRNSRGRPSEPGSIRDVAERIGIPRSTIERAEQHVAAVERYPELETATQRDAIQIAKKLDALPEDERPAFVLPEMPKETREEKAYYVFARQVLITQLEPEDVAAVAASPESAIHGFTALADWLARFNAALQARIDRPIRLAK